MKGWSDVKGWSRAVVLAIVVLGLCACGNGPVGSSAAPSPTPTPLGACPITEEAAVGCVPYDPDAAMRANDAYRQRRELPAEYRARAEEHRAQITNLIQDELVNGPLTPERLQALLGTSGYVEVESYGRSDVGGGLAVGVGTDAGCVFGGVRGDDVELEAGSGIADGGCIPAQGH